jgi:hypothetical protein
MGAVKIASQFLGLNAQQGGTTTFQDNAAANWIAFQVVPDATRTLNTVRAFLSAKAGTLIAADITCEIQSDTSFFPSGSTVTGGTAQPCDAGPASGWNGWSGFTCSLTANTVYWAVFKNANATPASNNVTFRYCQTLLGVPAIGHNRWGSVVATSTNSGGAWTRAGNISTGPRFGFGDGTYIGFPLSNSTVASAAIFGSTEIGVKFPLPSNIKANVRGIYATMNSDVGTPTGNLRFRLYTGSSGAPTLAGTTATIPNAFHPVGASNATYYAFFASNVVLDTTNGAAVTVRITASDDAADSSGNAYTLSEHTIDTDANSLALLPFGGSYQKTITTDGTNFTETNSLLYSMGLILDSDGEFAAPAAGGGLLLNSGMQGGLRG